ncbi:Eco57I restriction-modification methylase domain-containing protein [Haloimpatiens sp. FM7315]|uniref:Eco57I restriction-modification methylase domain-containing protein n=1 Tax=Haloimpatiens sp. FM7315 TaxID=3298609 RepID=UPI00370ADDA8
MTELFVKCINELYEIILSPIDILYKKQGINNYKNKLHMEQNVLFGELYNDILLKLKLKGVVYTPKCISKYMIKRTIKEEIIVNNPYKKIVDPACGSGNILIPCYLILKEIYVKNINRINKIHNLNLNLENIDEHILKNNLYGFDVDETALKILIIDFYSLTNVYSKNIKKCDFLKEKIDTKFDIFIGNPPYIGQKAVDKEYSKALKLLYKGIYKDKADVSYCFFKKAISSINKEGLITFITSRYFLESPSGEELRKVLKEMCSIDTLVDFYGIRPFKGVGIDPVIVFLKNHRSIDYDIKVIKPRRNIGKDKNKFCKSLFEDKNDFHKEFLLNKNLLNNKGWILRSEEERNIINKIEEKSFTTLNNICTSFQGIITGCDKAFVVNGEDIIREKIERELIKPWIKSSYIQQFKVLRGDKYLIYSDSIQNEDNYKNTINHIKNFKEKLLKRRECEKGIRKWYELQWGRVPEVFLGEKIVFPYKSSKNRFALDKGSFFSADVYCLKLKDNVPFTYDYLLFLLNSKVYEFYFKTFAKKLGGDLYEYYPNNLMKLCIPTMMKLNCENDLYTFFELSKEEITIIERNFQEEK